jgi:hypothetical protein
MGKLFPALHLSTSYLENLLARIRIYHLKFLCKKIKFAGNLNFFLLLYFCFLRLVFQKIKLQNNKLIFIKKKVFPYMYKFADKKQSFSLFPVDINKYYFH